MAALDRFSPVARAWFESAFEAPTDAQDRGWEAISRGDHTLILAPTGSGKTLAAFLWALDRLASEGTPADAKRRLRVLYVSPLKALTYDIERNLRAPLAGIGQAAARLGLTRPEIQVGIRSGDTPADERRAFTRRPTDILITTPESLFLLLTSSAREALRGVETVIVVLEGREDGEYHAGDARFAPASPSIVDAAIALQPPVEQQRAGPPRLPVRGGQTEVAEE